MRNIRIGADATKDLNSFQHELIRKLKNMFKNITDMSFWIGGTSNQIIVTPDGDGSITLSIPNTQVLTFTDTTTLTALDKGYIICNKGTAMTVNLPTIVGKKGLEYSICNIGIGTVTIEPNGAETIIGDSTFDLYTGESILIFASEIEWRV